MVRSIVGLDTTDLERVVTVIPRSAILRGVENVREFLAGSNWALCDSIDSIHVTSVQLSKTVPMDGGAIAWIYSCAITCQCVLDRDTQFVTPTCLKSGPREAVVEQLHCTIGETIGIASRFRKFKIVMPLATLRSVVFVVCADIKFLASFGIFEPAVAVHVGVA